jgi:hypothetical protein
MSDRVETAPPDARITGETLRVAVGGVADPKDETV